MSLFLAFASLIYSGLDSGFMTLRELMAHCGEYHIAQQDGNIKYVCKASEGRLVLFNVPRKVHLSMPWFLNLCFCPVRQSPGLPLSLGRMQVGRIALEKE